MQPLGTMRSALAHQGVQNPAVLARMTVMSAIAEDTKILGSMAKGDTAFAAEPANGPRRGVVDRYNLRTGKKDLYVDYTSDEDALPIEHEQDHRALVEGLIAKGALRAEEVGEVVISRVAPRDNPTDLEETAPVAAPQSLESSD